MMIKATKSYLLLKSVKPQNIENGLNGTHLAPLTTKTDAQKTVSTNHSESNPKQPQKIDSNMQKFVQRDHPNLQNQWRSIFFSL